MTRAPLSLTGVLAWGLTLGTVGMAAISALAWAMGWL